MAFVFEPAPLTLSPPDLRMHLAKSISKFSTHMHHWYDLFAPPALSRAPFEAADELVKGKGSVRFMVPGPNDAFFSLERGRDGVRLCVEMRCKVQAQAGKEREKKRTRREALGDSP